MPIRFDILVECDTMIFRTIPQGILRDQLDAQASVEIQHEDDKDESVPGKQNLQICAYPKKNTSNDVF